MSFVQFAYKPERGPGDGVDTVNPGDNRAPIALSSLFSGNVIAVHEQDAALVRALDQMWQLRRVGTSESGPSRTWSEAVNLLVTDPATGDTILRDENGAWLNAPASGGGASNASASVIGVTKLSVAPASGGNPVALGANDTAIKGSSLWDADEEEYSPRPAVGSCEFIGPEDPFDLDLASEFNTWIETP